MEDPGAPTTIAVVVDGDTVVASCQVDGRRHLDLSIVDLLARLQLSARRFGLDLRLTDPSADLYELLELVGLADRLEAGREAEGGKEPWVEEVVEPGDPPA